MAGSWTLLAFVVIFVGYSLWLGEKFLVVQNRMFDIHSIVPILLLALAAVATLLAGKFDLSISGMATLSAFLTIGLASKQGLPMGMVLVIVLVVGILGGLLNALLVVGLGINTFIATLGTSGLFLGASAVYSGGTQVAPDSTDTPLPTWFSNFGSFTGKPPTALVVVVVLVGGVLAAVAVLRARPARFSARAWRPLALSLGGVILLGLLGVLVFTPWLSDLSWATTALLLVATALWVVVDKTVFGRELRATGANPEAAKLAGVHTARTTVVAYALTGLLSAMAGVVAAASLGAAQPALGVPLLLPAFAAAFLSTVLFSRGHFNVWGAVVGGVFLQWVSQGLVNGGLAFTWNDVVNGFVLVLAVSISSLMTRSSSSTGH
ncbi:hypothetical protein GCM10010472_65780 [Pseudonocardia halophobica]|uniref:ABC transporter permease n=1 Tax=Pseudonocardia halophobica TaxID=29401 RepID=A0A9W6L8D0_9PSEU|nr:hypothetical protein GCM10017577_51740 [Pseudonocardia halophobica]